MTANGSTFDTILRLFGRDEGLDRLLDKERRKFREFAATEAKATLDVSDARVARGLRDAERRLAEFASQTASADAEVDTAKARADLERLKTQLGQIDRERASPEVNAKVAKALLALQALDAKLDAIDREDVTVDVDVRRGVAERALSLQRAIDGVADASESGAKALSLFGSSAGGAGGNIGSLGGSAGFAGGAFKVLLGAVVALIPVIFSLGAALAALVGSLGAAAAAAGALAVALGAAMGPALGVVGAAGMRVSGIMSTLSGSTSEAGSAASGAASSTSLLGNELKQTGEESEKLRAAQEKEYQSTIAVRDARESLVTALRSYREAVKRAWQEIRDAARDVRRVEADATRATKQARSEQKRAAQEAAAAVREAAAQEKEALRASTAANRELADALREVRDAHRAVRDAADEQQAAALALLDAEDALQGRQEDTKALLEGMGLSGEALQAVLNELATADLSKLDIGSLLAGAGVAATPGQIEKVSDAARELQHSQLGVKEANDAVADSSTLVTDAQDALTRAQEEAAEAQALVNEFAAKGVRAYEPYVQALQDVEAAERALSKTQSEVARIGAKGAQEVTAALAALQALQRGGVTDNPQVVAAAEGLRDARQALAQATREAAKATEEYGQAAGGGGGGAAGGIEELTGLDREFAETLEQVKTALANAFKPATTKVLEGIQGGLRAVLPLIRELRPGLTAIGEVIGGLARSAGQALAGPEWSKAIKFFIRSSAVVTKLVGESFGELAEILRDIAVASMPFLISGLRKVRDFLAGISDKTKNVGALRDDIGGLVRHLKAWLKLAGAVGAAMVALLGGETAEAGRELVEWLTKGADGLAKWARSADGQAEIKKFFEDVMPFVKSLVTLFGALLVAGLRFAQLMAPVMKPLIDAFTTFVEVVTDVLGFLTQLPTAVKTFIGSFSGLVLVVNYVKLLVSIFAEVPGAVKDAFEAAVKAISEAVPNAVKWAGDLGSGVLNAVVNGVKDLPSKVGGFFSDGWEKIKGWVAGFGTAAGGVARSALQGAVGVIKDLPGKVGEFFSNAWERIKGWADNFASAAETLGRKVLGGVAEFVKDVPGKIVEFLSAAKEKVAEWGENFFNAAEGAAKKLVNGFVEGAKTLGKMLGEALSAAAGIAADVGRAIRDWVNSNTLFGDKIHIGLPGPVPDIDFTMPALAKGVMDFAGGLALVGEHGPEIAALPQGTDVYTASQTRRILKALAGGAAVTLDGINDISSPELRFAPPPAARREVSGPTTYELSVQSPAGTIADPNMALAQLDAALRARGGVLGG